MEVVDFKERMLVSTPASSQALSSMLHHINAALSCLSLSDYSLSTFHADGKWYHISPTITKSSLCKITRSKSTWSQPEISTGCMYQLCYGLWHDGQVTLHPHHPCRASIPMTTFHNIFTFPQLSEHLITKQIHPKGYLLVYASMVVQQRYRFTE